MILTKVEGKLNPDTTYYSYKFTFNRLQFYVPVSENLNATSTQDDQNGGSSFPRPDGKKFE